MLGKKKTVTQAPVRDFLLEFMPGFWSAPRLLLMTERAACYFDGTLQEDVLKTAAVA